MAIILDEAAAFVLDEATFDIYDEAGAPLIAGHSFISGAMTTTTTISGSI